MDTGHGQIRCLKEEAQRHMKAWGWGVHGPALFLSWLDCLPVSPRDPPVSTSLHVYDASTY